MAATGNANSTANIAKIKFLMILSFVAAGPIQLSKINTKEIGPTLEIFCSPSRHPTGSGLA
jgi:hypothetical protein